MAALVYYLVLPFIYLISILPFPLLFLLSDVIYFVLYYIIGYRRKVVRQNLRNAFPDKTDKEIDRICRAFFRYLCDLMLETLKMLTISKREILIRCKFDPASKAIFDKLAEENKSLILVMGHVGNWEWSGHPFSLLLQQQLYVLYHPLANKYFDGLMHRIRSRNGTRLLPMKNAYKDMLLHKHELTATAFIADQTPQPNNGYWMTFLNQETPVFKGTEIIARKMNLPVIYACVKRTKRGHYTMYAELLTEDPASLPDGALTELHTRRLEQDILEQPETWLWSHKRWKHKRVG